MAQAFCVRLNKGDAPSLGFRLQGGKDFGTPLLVQKVNLGSPAEKAGLLAGDSVIKINATDVYNLRHKDAQDVIVRAGPSFEITVQRGGSTWKPSVTPLPKAVGSSYAPVTKTSLAAKSQTSIDSIGVGHNLSAKPFSPQLNGAVNGGPKLINKQYNSPVGLYSDQSIAETLSAQAEVLSTGALGVNFKKNEKNYEPTNSEVFRMVQEADKQPRQQESVNRQKYYATQSTAAEGLETRPRSNTSLSEHYDKCQGFGEYTQEADSCDQTVTVCSDCDRVILGVFVRIKDKNLHVECFKCATCGTSLKNIGYYNINQKLYCDVHAKLAALSNSPGSSLVPHTVLPGSKTPSGTISVALSGHSVPSFTPLPPSTLSSNTGAQPFQGGNSFSSPRPFASVAVPSTPPVNNYAPPKNIPTLQPTSLPRPTSGIFSAGTPFGALFKGAAGGRQSGAVGVAPKRGRGILNVGGLIGSRIATCGHCHSQIRGPFITALGKIWCPEHFICSSTSCKRPLQDLGFVEEQNNLYCEYCFEQYIAPPCSKCGLKIKGDCLKAIGKNFHPECFSCSYCGKLFSNSPFFLEDGQPYCDNDWNELFTTKCFACGFPVEAGDRWVEALNNNYHSQCFNCTMCKKNLEGQSFFAKGGRPFCKNHAR